jgi:NAD+ diphosphatase
LANVPALPELPLSHGTVDFASERREDAGWLAERVADPTSRVLLMRGFEAVVTADATAVHWFSPAEAGTGTLGPVFLGIGAGTDDAGVAYFAVMDPADVPLPEVEGLGADGPTTATLRDVGMLLSPTDAGLVVHALALARWHQNHRFCARCGAASDVASAGHTRRCPVCNAQHFPRTDAAIIVLITDAEDRALLIHGAAWVEGQYSTLAGFVEPGESLEAAVIREVGEESGITVVDPVYAGSQPWPFPASLMLGYFATAATTDVSTDDVEVTAARWFTRDDFKAEVEAGHVRTSSGLSISHQLIKQWYGGPLPVGPLHS